MRHLEPGYKNLELTDLSVESFRILLERYDSCINKDIYHPSLMSSVPWLGALNQEYNTRIEEWLLARKEEREPDYASMYREALKKKI